MIRKAIIVVLTLAAVGSIATWVATLHWSFDYWHGADGITVGHGAVCLQLWHNVLLDGWVAPEQGWRIGDSGKLLWTPRWYSRSGSLYGVDLPLWIPFILFVAYPTIAFIRGPARRYRRRKRGECLKCGYNLTGLPEPRCPECGEAL